MIQRILLRSFTSTSLWFPRSATRISSCIMCISGHANSKRYYGKWQRKSGRNYKNHNEKPAVPVLIAVSYWALFKDYIGYDKIELDKDPLASALKRSWLLRKYNRHSEAIEVLHELLRICQAEQNEMAVTRVHSELAATYSEMDKNEEAEQLFRSVLSRFILIHHLSDNSFEFIDNSLKLAILLTKKGEAEHAEAGFRHCLDKQAAVVSQEVPDLRPVRGSFSQMDMDVGCNLVRNRSYYNNLALYGMICEEFGHFLLDQPGHNRLPEAEILINKAIELASYVYGSNNVQTVIVINNFAIQCLFRERYELAERLLKLCIDRATYIPKLKDQLAGYYTNYAEALYHVGKTAEALEQANHALLLANTISDDPNIKQHVKTFVDDLKNERKKKPEKKERTSKGWGLW